ncbi:Membrane-bound lytic murein transglycosylase B precursor [compost metagenome]
MPNNPLSGDKEWLRKELQRIGFSKSFTEECIEKYEPKGFNTVVTLNLMGFLQPSGPHLLEVTPKAVARTASFIKENQVAFNLAQTRYDVPADVISSLLWIETRHGEDIGTFHTVSVYLHLLQTKRAINVEKLTKLALAKNKEVKKYKPKELRKLMVERTKKKSDWAQDQLIALASLRKKKHVDVASLRGSYAGAFGLPQFIPSSYRDFAAAQKEKAVPNLTKAGDAIMSVARYLAESGWKNDNAEAKVAALMKYNNSRDYADGILRISQRIPANEE